MTPTLLDTNVLSELLRDRPHEAVRNWFIRQPMADLRVSAVTQAEMLLGARLLPPGRRRERLERALSTLFDNDFADRTLAFDSIAAVACATIVAMRRAAGRPIQPLDAQIAATALAHGAAAATRDRPASTAAA